MKPSVWFSVAGKWSVSGLGTGREVGMARERKLKRQGQIPDGLDAEAEEFGPDSGDNGED